MKSEPEPAKLTLQLLGPPQIRWQSASLKISRRQARAVLYRLAADAHPVAREHLAFLIWPDVPEATARRNLVRLLSYLRQTLPHPDCLIINHNNIQLNPAWVWSDCQTVVGLSGNGDVAALTAIPPLYRGAFLAGFSLPDSPEFEQWWTQTAVIFEQLHLTTLSKLITWYSEKNELEKAIATARRYLAIDELAEEVHCQLLTLYGQLGDRTAVVRQFEQCSLIMERELAVSPLPATRAAYERAVQGITKPRPTPVIKPQWAVLPSLDLPLVGRDAALQTVTKAVTQAASGGLVLISGEPGVGKSRLLQTFALASNCLVLTGNSHLATHAIPYQPLLEALHQALDEPLRWHKIPPIWKAEASRLLPEMREIFPELPQPVTVEPEQAQARLFAGLTHCFLELATDKPLLLCLDDLHWADTATLNWLIGVTSRLTNTHFCIVATYRSGEAAALTDVRRSFRRANCLTEVPLVGLTLEAIVQVLHKLHLPWSEEMVKIMAGRLHRATGGNTFFVLETIRTLLASDYLAEPPEMLPLATAVEEVVRSRLEQLTAVSKQIIQAAAVLSPHLQASFIQQTAGRTDLELADALDELTARHLLQETDNGHRFNHSLVQTAVYQEITPWRRKTLHHRAAKIISTVAKSTDLYHLTAIAQHYHAAAAYPEAIDAYQKTATAAQAIYAFAQAIAHLQQAIHLLPTTETNPTVAAALHETLADNLTINGDFGLAETAYRAALALVSDAEHLQLAQLERKLAATLSPQQRLEEAEKIYRTALARLHTVKSPRAQPARLNILLGLLDVLYFQHRPEAMAELKEATQVLLTEVGTAAQQIAYYARLDQIAFLQNRFYVPAESIVTSKKNLLIAQESGDQPLIARCHFHLGFCLLWHSDLDKAEEPFQQALASAQALGDSWLHVQCLAYLTILYRLQGNQAQAVVHSSRLEKLSQQIGYKLYIAVGQANRAWLHYRVEEWQQAQTQAKAALLTWIEGSYPFQWLASIILLAICVTKNQLEQAIAAAEAMLDSRQQRPPEALAEALEEAVAQWHRGHRHAAAVCMQRAITVAMKIGYL